MAVSGIFRCMVPNLVRERNQEAAAKLARAALKPPWQELTLAFARALREELKAAGVVGLQIAAELGGEEGELLVDLKPAEEGAPDGG